MATLRRDRLELALVGIMAVLIGILVGMLLWGRQSPEVLAGSTPDDERQAGEERSPEPEPAPPVELEPAPAPETVPDPPPAPPWVGGDGATRVSIDVAWERSCGVWDDGSLQCWGEDVGDRAVATEGTLLRAVSLGDYHGCGIAVDGVTLCWGSIEGRPFAAPSLDLISLRAVGKQQCGLTTVGSVVCWGVESNVDRVFGRGFVTFDVGLHGAICGIDADGAMQCDGGIPVPLAPPDDRFTHISVGESRACGVTVDGEVLCFGHRVDEHRQASADGVRFVEVGIANDGGCNLREDSELRCWGRLAAAGAVPVRDPLSTIAVGESHACAISTNGKPVCWGSNTRGQARPPSR